MTKIKVMLVEDEAFWREQLVEDLGNVEKLDIVGVASSRDEAVSRAVKYQPDVILMDINMSENRLDGIEATKDIRRLLPDAKIIMLTSLNENEIIVDAFKSGAVNYITKSSIKDIVFAIEQAYENRSGIHADAAKAMITELKLSDLTPMEREVYKLKQDGLNKTQIADALFKSINTIKTQLRSIKDKLNK